ncbi:hypothetical protein [Streptobacillus moniliformis]|uniref:Uncharacterized protein n=1 Tax=Streptobacillus moniliformis (strain ATCC 14647 / DSM 12112 / NCTC 10651 / 9901) TaxID=519441 RepID=D1AUU5_STRM9|nr:hypothetical protein [Streptobacillus moniliformis]ACZ01505.1 hypothetical protein Smon_1042 [Streptobacillus moniliformis DSM 12112]AVL43495.1 hypothetical protein CEP89_06630 [Streptobacillus moniliformis]SQA13331.1 Uncharacterised protein [Streptobacillus moniliformis]
MIILLWLYYSKLYILGSLLVTFFLNKITDKLYLPPLIINMVAVIMLFVIPYNNRTYAMYFNYMPIVVTSVLLNFIIYLFKRCE